LEAEGRECSRAGKQASERASEQNSIANGYRWSVVAASFWDGRGAREREGDADG
jgi:hypothetical protein